MSIVSDVHPRSPDKRMKLNLWCAFDIVREACKQHIWSPTHIHTRFNGHETKLVAPRLGVKGTLFLRNITTSEHILNNKSVVGGARAEQMSLANRVTLTPGCDLLAWRRQSSRKNRKLLGPHSVMATTELMIYKLRRCAFIANFVQRQRDICLSGLYVFEFKVLSAFVAVVREVCRRKCDTNRTVAGWDFFAVLSLGRRWKAISHLSWLMTMGWHRFANTNCGVILINCQDMFLMRCFFLCIPKWLIR